MRVVRGSEAPIAVRLGTPGSTLSDVEVTATSAATGATVVWPSSVDGVIVEASPATGALDLFDVAFSASVDGVLRVQRVPVSVVERDVVSVADVMALPSMAGADVHEVAWLCDALTERAEEYVGRALVGQMVAAQVDLVAGCDLVLDRPIRTIQRVVQDAGAVAGVRLVSEWVVSGSWVTGPGEAVYRPQVIPWSSDVSRTLASAVRREYLARGANAPVDTLSETFDGRTVRLAQPGRDKPTGTLAADTALTELRDAWSIPGFG